ncbi:MAG TPA: cytochrome P450 [Candidatus Binatia bacterium]|nr:cytochrome P450 [Candidatus Binatia bacterium]
MELNPFSYEFHEDPYPTYRWLRDHAPLYRNERMDFWALSRFTDVMTAFVEWQTYSSTQGVLLERLDPAYLAATPMMIFEDPPRHDRLRRLVSRVFTPKRIAALEPLVRDITVRYLDSLAAAGRGDFVKDFSGPLPTDVISTMLGVPEGDRHQIREWTDMALDRDPDTPDIPARAIEAGMLAMRYWYELLPELRRHPNDGLICALFDAEIDTDAGRTRLTDGEIVGFCSLLGAAGSETTTRLLASAALLFARHPEEYAKILAAPARIPGAVEEVLRHSAPAQYAARTVMRDVEWYAQKVPEGARMLILIASANRDERVYPDPDRFDIDRRIETLIAFGEGVHFCLGASLARLETRVALEEFAQRFPRYAVDEGRAVRVHMSNVHGFSSLPFART